MSVASFALVGRTVLITGGAGGIGAATARLMAERGAKVVLADRDDRVEAVAEEVGGATGWVVADVADPEGAAAAVANG